MYLDPPVGVSWLDYTTLPIGFQTGHPDWRVLVYEVQSLTGDSRDHRGRTGTDPTIR